MKRLLLSVLIVGFALQSKSQCIPFNEFTGSGIAFSPVPLNPVYAYVGSGDLEVVLSLQTFADTTLAVELSPGNPPLDVTVFADFFRLDSIGGLPSGLTYTTDAAYDTTFDPVENPFGYWINPGDTTNGFTPTNGCITISGSEAAWNAAAGGGPNNDGIYPLTVFLDARAANFSPAAIGGIVGFNTWLTDMGVLLDAFGDPNFTVNGIKLEGNSLDIRQSDVGIESVDSHDLSEARIHPNPFSDVTNLVFRADRPKDIQIEIFNVLGDRLRSSSVQVIKGENRVEIRREDLSTGVYFYQVADGEVSITKRMIVN